MTITIDPSIEACQALVARINAGSYGASVSADYTEEQIEPLENIGSALLVTVVPVDEQQLNETIATEDRTSHSISIYVRQKLNGISPQYVDPLQLITRRIWSQVNNFDTADNRVRVWECDFDKKAKPDKFALKNEGIYLATINLRVEVEAS